MSAQERWSDDEFIALMAGSVGLNESDEAEPVHLASERHNPVVSWDEFAGNFN